MYLAQVIARQGNTYIVENKLGDHFDCYARTNAIDAICGDHVECIAVSESKHVIEKILSRKNQITRIDKFKREKTIAANIDHMVIVLAARPVFTNILIDKYLACAQINQCKTTIVVNKAELLLAEKVNINCIENIYRSLVENFLVTSARLGYGIQALRNIIGNENTILVGQSGVGKSSLINRLLNTNEIKVGELSLNIQQGKHTTTNAFAHTINQRGKIIDSPGVRTFMPIFTDKQQVASGYKEFSKYTNECKYTDCLHVNEPHCAIRNKAEHGVINESRYKTYLEIIEEINNA